MDDLQGAGDGRFRKGGFTMIEALVAAAIMALILVLLMQMLGMTSGYWRNLSGSAKAFEGARAAFERITKGLSQATLNVEYDYYDASRRSRTDLAAGSGGAANLKSFVPAIYGRRADLHFMSGPGLVAGQHNHALFCQSPLDFTSSSGEQNQTGRLNSVGWFVRYGSNVDDDGVAPSGLKSEIRKRFRLYQYLQPSDRLDVYRTNSGTAWFKNDVDPDNPKNCSVLAENIVVLAVLPKLPEQGGAPPDALAPGFQYDSRKAWVDGSQPVQMHQLPPVVHVVMVAVDEPSVARNEDLGIQFKDLFKDPKELDADLDVVESVLINARAHYQIFRADIAIRSAKWSQ
jgi:uncharacterized protein (TIGR02599 family)